MLNLSSRPAGKYGHDKNYAQIWHFFWEDRITQSGAWLFLVHLNIEQSIKIPDIHPHITRTPLDMIMLTREEQTAQWTPIGTLCDPLCVPFQVAPFQVWSSNPSQGNFLWWDSNDNSY